MGPSVAEGGERIALALEDEEPGELVAGLVGEAPAAEFEGFVRTMRDLPSLAAVLANPGGAPVPSEPSAQYAMAAALARSGSSCSSQLSVKPAAETAAAVMKTGRRRVFPASIAASVGERPFSIRISFAKTTRRLEFETAIPTAMMVPIKDSTLSVVPVMNSIVTMPHKVAGSAKITTKGSPKF